MIEVCNLCKKYGTFTAVDDLSFTLEKGEILGFLGPNGAGKSTTMNMITGYISATNGSVTISGHDLFSEPEEAKRSIGYLPEIPPVYPDMRVSEYLLFAAELKGIKRSERKAEVRRVSEKTDIVPMSGKLIRHLSKGYRQRVGLSAAMLGNPPVLILDEPTVGLDPAQIIEMRNLIRELAKDHSILISSHILFEVQNICTRVLIINHGKQIALDTPEHIVKNLGGTEVYTITVKGTAETAVRILSGVPGITAVTHVTGTEEGKTVLSVGFPHGTDIREDVFYAFAEAKVPILSGVMKERSLEDIFLLLTQEENREEA